MDGYFHKPDALEQSLQSINPVIKAQKREEIAGQVEQFLANGGRIRVLDIQVRRRLINWMNRKEK